MDEQKRSIHGEQRRSRVGSGSGGVEEKTTSGHELKDLLRVKDHQPAPDSKGLRNGCFWRLQVAGRVTCWRVQEESTSCFRSGHLAGDISTLRKQVSAPRWKRPRVFSSLLEERDPLAQLG